MIGVVNPRDGTIVTMTPAGQIYRSDEPPLPRARPAPSHTTAFRIDLIWPVHAA